MTTPQPGIGEWYRRDSENLFEVVAIDEDDGTIEIQYFDGTVEEMDFEDWNAACEEGALRTADPPEDWSGSVDIEPEERGSRSDPYEGERELRASGLDSIDLFD